MRNIYYNTPNAAVAANYKSGSATLARAVILAYQPETEAMLNNTSGDGNGLAYPPGKSAANTRWHGLVATCDASDKPATLIPVRDPIEKFRSACAEDNITDVDAHLDWLEENPDIPRLAHFWPQSRLIAGNLVKLYRFPADLDALATEAGLALPLPNIAGDNQPKPTLSPTQLVRVQAIYADDITLFESIAAAGQEFIPPTPPPAPIHIPHTMTAWQAQAALKLTPFAGGGVLYPAVLAALDAMPAGPQKIVAVAAFEKDARFVRDSPTIGGIAAALNLTDADIDALFILGDSLVV
jgi:hypothetical protein